MSWLAPPATLELATADTTRRPAPIPGTASLPIPEKSFEALFSGVRDCFQPANHPRPRADQRPVSAEQLLPPKVDADAEDLHKPEESDARTRGRSAAAIQPLQLQEGGSSRVDSAEREARSRIAALTPAETGERLMRMGVGAGLVSALEEHNVDGARLLGLTNADLVAMGIEELYSREIVLRAATYILSREREHVGTATTTLIADDGLPQYSQ
ncbi:hypothetical protein HDU96_008360 [Phlyctochytrium bullatum]|nr:hypothetical protein HDU96_008360 [Phlyctochytrium bullatum]